MARTGSGALLSRRNIKLDSFLKRNMERMVYERIRAYEPCVVKSETINKVYMHVVLSDERVYLTEYPPRTLTEAFCFRDVQDIELVNDLPDFLRGKDRELCQHIRVTYITDKPAARGRDWLRRDRRVGLPPRRPSLYPTITHTLEGYPEHGSPSGEEVYMLPPTRSASCPNPETLGLLRVPHPPTQSVSTTPSLHSPNGSPTSSPSSSNHRLNIPDTGQLQRRIGSVLARLLRRDCVNSGEEREAELHLYAISHTSRLYLHMQSSWNSFIIRSTLLLDTLFRGRCSASSDSSSTKQLPAISCERTAHLFGQLSSELLQEGIGVERFYLLLQELRTAAHHNLALRRLFWKTSEVCVFLVQTLEESLHGFQSLTTQIHTEDQLLGSLTSRMLLALICDAELQTQNPADCELQALLAEYLDAACSLLFELLLSGHEASRCLSADNFLSVGWILGVLQPHPHLLSFISYQAQQVVLVLSDGQESFLSPFQSVLLFQRCRLLLACLQSNSRLAQHLQFHFREEFRYSVKLSCAQEKLPPHYPISRPTLRLLQQIRTLFCTENRTQTHMHLQLKTGL
ncbi:uncharacterized protein C12orf56 homolog isoform X5 [Etheostoma spectabile]|uniref:uncharacterized protein C12orf56 homolog isoform X5 n=1 Tax=Etheostoma spectabile TaxID=54343 RepID=UPI0013AEADDD|nr:uncharacterized protein C12orf56 homolog isoform X5 [Etheostoma spectabile]